MSTEQTRQIGLDAHLLSMRAGYRSAGVSHYIYHLLTCLPEADAALAYTAFLPERCPDLPGTIHQSVSRLPTRRPAARILWEQFAGPLVALRQKLDLWHAMVNVQPLALTCPAVVTIQDLSFMVYPESFHGSKRRYNRLFVRLTARRANHIIAISQSTKDDIVRHFGVPSDKVTVVYMGVDDEFHPLPAHSVDAFREKKGLPPEFILYVGTIEPRKNLARLIRSFALLRKAGLSHHLIIGGGKGWMYDQVFAVVQEEGLQDCVHFPGFIAQEELAWWYNAADLFVYPSLYEGFGIPPLEAMACGTPVVVSNVSSLPEVVGDTGETVNPESIDEIAEAMRRLVVQREQHEARRAAGLARARTFSWQRAAFETTRVYHRVLDGRVKDRQG
jgi:glycosyltransferase involved in cell wall biosynthesis